MTTLEGNKLIAEFMGWEANKYSHLPNKLHKIDTGQEVGIHIDQMEYHTSWDWIMPVVEKIQSIDITPAPNYTGYRIEIVVQGYVRIVGFPMPPIFTNVSVEGSLIAAIWKAIVQFIQWYNKQTTPAKVDDKKGDY